MSTKSGNNKPCIDLENWMGQLPEHLTRIPVIHLAIPGSHNSFTYSLSPSAGVSPDSPEIVQWLGKWCKPLGNRIVYNWSMGQKENVISQLSAGIRYFDIRLVSHNGEIHIAHGLYGGFIETFLQEIGNFLYNHRREVVILDFQHFYKFTNQNHQFVVGMIDRIFGPTVCRRRMPVSEINLDQMWKQGKQVIAIYRQSYVNYTDLCWPSGSWVTLWPNKINTNDLLVCLDNGISNRNRDVGFVSQGILTPTIKYVVFHIGSSLYKLALRNNEKLSKWLEAQSNGVGGINIVICDFIESYSFCEKVVQLNYKSIESSKGINHNEQLRSEIN